MEEKMCTHLSKRGSTYYFRRKTPVDLIHVFGKEIVKSLGTKDRKQAEILVRKMGSYFDELFSQALIEALGSVENSSPIPTPRNEKTKPPAFDAGLSVNDSHIYEARYLKKLRVGREKAATENNLYNFNAAMDNLKGDSKEYLKTGVHPFDDEPVPMWKAEAQLMAVRALKKNKDLPYTGSADLSSNSPEAKRTTQFPLSNELIAKWAAERKPRPQSVVKMSRVIERFEEIVGVIRLPDITKVHAVAFKDGLLAGGSTAANVNQYLTEFNTLLNFAKNQAIIDSNPASGVKVKVQESAKVKRQPFDLQALKLIFASAIYTSSARPIGGKGEASFWLPLLALYTGARLEELCQLNTSDIYQDSYQDGEDNMVAVWVLYVTDEGDGQRLKNSGSRRRIPIHRKLITLGFLKYVQGLNGGKVFPELTPSSTYGKLSASWSKWFGRYLRKTIAITDKRMVFHSFRHCFKDYARVAGIPSEVHNALTGHSSGNVADNYGSDKYPLRPLAEAMDKYKVVGLEFP